MQIDEQEIKKLIKLLRGKSTKEWKKVNADVSHYEGMCKGLHLGYEEAASRLQRLIEKQKLIDKRRETYGIEPHTFEDSVIIKSAIAWWQSRRPVAFTKRDHLDNPTINTTSGSEQSLANAVAKYLKERIKS